MNNILLMHEFHDFEHLIHEFADSIRRQPIRRDIDILQDSVVDVLKHESNLLLMSKGLQQVHDITMA